jgi:hypothetical protein
MQNCSNEELLNVVLTDENLYKVLVAFCTGNYNLKCMFYSIKY